MLQLLENSVCAAALGTTNGIPSKIAYIIHLAVMLLQIAVPVLLIIWGMLDLGKAVMAQKEDEIKKGQQTFVKRIVAAAIIFFVVVIVRLLISLLADSDDAANITSCIDSILSCDSTECTDK